MATAQGIQVKKKQNRKLSFDKEVFVDFGDSKDCGMLLVEVGADHCGWLNKRTVRTEEQSIQGVTCEGEVRWRALVRCRIWSRGNMRRTGIYLHASWEE